MVLFWWVKPKRLFGCSLIEGNFWAGKTFWVEASTYERCWNNKDYLVISNIPFERADIVFNSWSDFVKLLDHLYNYFYISNNDVKAISKYKKIYLIMDECHIYFPARKSMDKSRSKVWDKLNVVMTQCRKRNVKIDLITQRVQKTDIDFRRLAEFIYFYNKTSFLGLPINKLSIIRAWWGLSDLIWEDGTTWSSLEDLEKDVIYKWFARHNTFYFRQELKLKHKDWPLWREKHLTNFICGISPINLSTWEILADDLDDVYNLTWDEFYSKLLLTPTNDLPIVNLINRDSIPIFTFWHKFYDYENSKKWFDFRKKYYKLSCV